MQSPRSHYGKHISASSLSTAANALVGIWFARFLAHQLGLAGYAVVAMATALTMALTVFTSSGNSAVGRFLTEALARSDRAEADRVFNSALFGMVAAVIALIPAIWLASTYSPAILGTGERPELVRDYTLLVLLATALLSVMAVFTSTAFAASRFDLLSGLQTSQLLLRVALVAALVLAWGPTVRSVGLATLASAVGSLGLAVALWRHVAPQLTIRVGAISGATLRAMTSMGLWVGVDTAGTLAIYSLSTVLLGNLVGAVSAAHYGLYLSAISCVGMLGGALSGPVQPTIYAAYARGDRGEATRLLLASTRISLAVLGLLSAGIVGLRLELVGIWLGDGFEAVAGPLAVGVPLYAFAIALSPCLAALNARDRTSWIATATVIAGVCHLATCLALHALGRLEVVAVALSAGVWVVAKMLVLLWLSFDDARYAAKTFLRLAGHFAVLFGPPLAVAVTVEELVDLPALGKTAVAGLATAAAWAVCACLATAPGDADHLLGHTWRSMPVGRAFLEVQARKVSLIPRRQRAS